MTEKNTALCIGCGNCAAIDNSSHNVIKTAHGDFRVETSNLIELKEICPVGKEATSKEQLKEEYFVGHITGSERLESSSGGVTTYILSQLLKRKLVTQVVHVGQSGLDSTSFEYQVSRTLKHIHQRKKTRYQIVGYGDIIDALTDPDEKTAFVGVPCMIDGIVRLAERKKLNVVYKVAIMCGQQKLKSYTDYLINGLGEQIERRDVKTIDYRSKSQAIRADDYSFELRTNDDKIFHKKAKDYQYNDWGLGFLKPDACDVCQNVFSENSDIVLGDAWQRPYSLDAEGNNVIVVRSKTLGNFLKEGREKQELALDSVEFEFVKSTQAGTMKHRTIGRNIRLGMSVQSNLSNVIYYKVRQYLGKRLNQEYLAGNVSISTRLLIVFYKKILNNKIYAKLRS